MKQALLILTIAKALDTAYKRFYKPSFPPLVPSVQTCRCYACRILVSTYQFNTLVLVIYMRTLERRFYECQ